MSTTCGRPSFVWLGTGTAVDTQLLDQFLEQHDNGAAVLLDARESVVEELQQRYVDQTNYSVSCSVVDQQTGRSTFYTLNLPEFSSLQRPTGLIALFPGAIVQKTEPVETVGVDKYIAGLGIEKSQPNELYIDIPAQAGTIIRQLIENQQLHCFTQLHLSASLESLYEDAEKLVDIEYFLSKQGYEVVSTDNADPDIPLVSFKLNPLWQTLDGVQQQLNEALERNVTLVELHQAEKQELFAKVDELSSCIVDKNKEQTLQSKQVSALQQQLDGKAKQIIEQTQKVEAEQSAKAELQQLLKQSEDCKAITEESFIKLREQIADLKQQLDSKTKQIVEQTQKFEAEKSTKAELQAILENTKDVKSKLEGQVTIGPLEALIEEKLQRMVAVQSQEINKTIGNLKNHVTASLGNTAKQLECFYGIQSYIERGVKPLSFHGWPISPDIGLYITGLIDSNNYDVIIEFGSGTSTVLMAKALQMKQLSLPVRTDTDKRSKGDKKPVLTNSDYVDLPSKIVTFEHNSYYYDITLKALENNDVGHLVDLVHAPLVDYKYKDESQYLYYNCEYKLNQLANVFKDRKMNVLVLVDGPPGGTNKNARFPALVNLLNILPENVFTIVMDDYNRSDEKEIMDLWQEMAADRGIKCKFEVIPSEKGLAVLKII